MAVTTSNTTDKLDQKTDYQAKPTETYPQNSIDWLSRLIGFDTVSRYSNLALIKQVQAYCEQLGLPVDLTFNEAQDKANLFVTVAAGEHADVSNGGLVLSGHTDVVPVDGQQWTSNPFNATIRGSRLYGRGSCDMKGFIACALNLLPAAVKLSRAGKLQRPIHLALSFDEEVDDLNDHARNIFGQADGLEETNFTVELSRSDKAEATDAHGGYSIQIDINEDMSADEMMERINKSSQYVSGEVLDANKEIGRSTIPDVTLRIPTWAIEAIHDKHL